MSGERGRSAVGSGRRRGGSGGTSPSDTDMGEPPRMGSAAQAGRASRELERLRLLPRAGGATAASTAGESAPPAGRRRHVGSQGDALRLRLRGSRRCGLQLPARRGGGGE